MRKFGQYSYQQLPREQAELGVRCLLFKEKLYPSNIL